MLVDVTTDARMDVVSSHGYAWGYIEAVCLFVISLVFVLFYDKIGITMGAAMAVAFFPQCSLVASGDAAASSEIPADALCGNA